MSAMQSSNLPQTYEDFQPLAETKETPESLLLLVHLPGFGREHVGANYEAAYKRVRVYGERPLENNKWQRFNVEYQIPENGDADKLRGKFEEGAIITISIPKKPISSVAPKEEPKPAQEAAKQITPKSTSEGEAEKAIKEGEKGISQETPKSTMESQRESVDKKVETPTPPKAKDESKTPQKEQKGLPQKGITEDEKQRDEKKETKEISPPPEATGESRTRMPQKDQEEISQEGKLDDEKQRAEMKETKKEDNGKTSEAGKPPQKADSLVGKERKEERKEPARVAAESPVLKTAEKGKKAMDGKSSEECEGNFGKTISDSSIGKGIKNVANSASQAVTRLANRFTEEDKQKLIYAGAAILVVAIGVYASFKLRSSSRP